MSGLLSMFGKKHKTQACWAIVVAAGASSRMRGIDKMLAPLGDLPVLVHTLLALDDCAEIDAIIVVTREDLLVEISHLCRDFGIDKVSKLVVGGQRRIDSVWAGIQEIGHEVDLIAIHDGARPFLTQTVAKHVIEQAKKSGAAAPAVAVVDTLKRAVDGVVVKTLPRSELYAVQTPQVFEAGLLRAAIKDALDEGLDLTDDCAAVERLGMNVTLSEGSRENIKITTPLDLLLGEAILADRER